MTAKCNSSGDLQQLTPWFLRTALMNSPGHRYTKVIARLENPWARACGNFDSSVGALWAMIRLKSIFKNNDEDNVWPISVCISLKRLLAKAQNSKLITRIDIIKDKLKLGTKKAGYEIGFTRFEPLPKKCWITGYAILEPDLIHLIRLTVIG